MSGDGFTAGLWKTKTKMTCWGISPIPFIKNRRENRGGYYPPLRQDPPVVGEMGLRSSGTETTVLEDNGAPISGKSFSVLILFWILLTVFNATPRLLNCSAIYSLYFLFFIRISQMPPLTLRG
jgi:hypothetical protein